MKTLAEEHSSVFLLTIEMPDVDLIASRFEGYIYTGGVGRDWVCEVRDGTITPNPDQFYTA